MITTEKEYNEAIEQIEVLLQDSENIENVTCAGYAELNRLGDLVAEYEAIHFPM